MFSTERRRRTLNRLDSLRSSSLPSRPANLRSAFTSKYLATVLATLVTTVLATIIITYGGHPFPFRLGDRVDRELRLSEPIAIENATETRAARERARREAPLVYEHNSEPIDRLIESLTSFAHQFADNKEFDDLGEATITRWNLNPEEATKLRKILPHRTAADQFERSIKRVLRPFQLYGLLDPKDLPEESKREGPLVNLIAIKGPHSPDIMFTHKFDKVSLRDVAQDKGALYESLRAEFPGDTSGTVMRLIFPNLQKTLTFDQAATRAQARSAMQNIKPVIDEYARGTLVASPGSTLGPDEIRLLLEEHRQQQDPFQLVSWISYKRWMGIAALVAAMLVTGGICLLRLDREGMARPSRIVGMLLILLTTLLVARLLSIDPYRAQIVPVALASFYVAVVLNQQVGLMFAVMSSLLISLSLSEPLVEFVVMLSGTTLGVVLLDSVRSRTKLIVVGLLVGSVYAGSQIAMGLYFDMPMDTVLLDAIRNFAWGLIGGLLMSGTLPFVEPILGIVTDISLLELADSSHPLLQDLIRRAPGTYNHSVTVSMIAETAAKSIGCNALLVRVAALFHDIGKMLKPQYFIENKPPDEISRHNQLAPAISTLIIIGHVKDGLELARQHHLPKPILDVIEQHHGTTLVDYFYHEAARALQRKGDIDEDIEETSFRYPGPKPQTKETAVLMLADCVEGASRALEDPSPARIEKLVHNLTMNRLLDGQFEECGITLQEIRTVEQSLRKSLTSVYHGRIKYPAAV